MITKCHFIINLFDSGKLNISFTRISIIYLVVVLLCHLPELHLAVQAGGLLAGEGVLGEVTGEGLLVKHSPFSTDEAVLVHPIQTAVIVVYRVTDVKNLAVVQSV